MDWKAVPRDSFQKKIFRTVFFPTPQLLSILFFFLQFRPITQEVLAGKEIPDDKRSLATNIAARAVQIS